MNLWPFQDRTVDCLRMHSSRRIAVCSPTGSGKGIMMGYIAAMATKKGLRTLILAHRLELVDSIAKKIELWGCTNVGVMRGDDGRTNPDALVQIASVATLARRKLPPADLVLSDEMHHDASEGRRAILEKYPNANIFGWSATPCRLDGKPLKDVYDDLIVAASYSELIAGKYIVAPRVYSTPAIVDLSQVKTVAGDYAIDQLETVMTQVNGDVVKEWQKHAGGRPGIVFACTIKHSMNIVEEFTKAGVRAEHLDGTVSEDARRACLRRLRDGLTQVVSNVNVLTEGFDEPAIKYVALARPTQSLGLYMQMAGRDMRPWYDVTPILMDHSGNVDRFGLPTEDRIWGLYDAPRLKKPSPYRTCPKCYAFVLKNPCELCGYAPTPEERRIREARATGLVERTETDVRRVFFITKLAEARAKGFKPGWVYVKFREKFNEQMPWSWGEEAKQAMTVEWQARIERRAEERSYWQKQNEGSVEVDVPDDAQETEVEDDVTIDQEGLPF